MIESINIKDSIYHKGNISLALLLTMFGSTGVAIARSAENCSAKGARIIIMAENHPKEDNEEEQAENITAKRRIITRFNPDRLPFILALEGLVRGKEPEPAASQGSKIIGIENEIPDRLHFLFKNLAVYKVFWNGMNSAAKVLTQNQQESSAVWLSALPDRNVETRVKNNIRAVINQTQVFKTTAEETGAYDRLNGSLSTTFAEEQKYSEAAGAFLSALLIRLEQLRGNDPTIKIMPSLDIAWQAIWLRPGDKKQYEQYTQSFTVEWRTHVFALNILNYVCADANSSSLIFVSVGSRHAEGLKSELEGLLGESAEIRVEPI